MILFEINWDWDFEMISGLVFGFPMLFRIIPGKQQGSYIEFPGPCRNFSRHVVQIFWKIRPKMQKAKHDSMEFHFYDFFPFLINRCLSTVVVWRYTLYQSYDAIPSTTDLPVRVPSTGRLHAREKALAKVDPEMMDRAPSPCGTSVQSRVVLSLFLLKVHSFRWIRKVVCHFNHWLEYNSRFELSSLTNRFLNDWCYLIGSNWFEPIHN